MTKQDETLLRDMTVEQLNNLTAELLWAVMFAAVAVIVVWHLAASVIGRGR